MSRDASLHYSSMVQARTLSICLSVKSSLADSSVRRLNTSSRKSAKFSFGTELAIFAAAMNLDATLKLISSTSSHTQNKAQTR